MQLDKLDPRLAIVWRDRENRGRLRIHAGRWGVRVPEDETVPVRLSVYIRTTGDIENIGDELWVVARHLHDNTWGGSVALWFLGNLTDDPRVLGVELCARRHLRRRRR